MEFQTAAYELQQTLEECGDMVLNFEYLEAKSKIGEGSTCQVFNGRYNLKGNVLNVAIKFYTPQSLTVDELQQFTDEGKVSHQFKHRNIVTFYGICVCPPQILFVTELCDGGNLRQHLQKYDRFPNKWSNLKKYQACYDACAALDYLHSTNYIHRDVKTENFFVISASNVITIADRRSRAVTNLPPPHSSDIIIKLGNYNKSIFYYFMLYFCPYVKICNRTCSIKSILFICFVVFIKRERDDYHYYYYSVCNYCYHYYKFR